MSFRGRLPHSSAPYLTGALQSGLMSLIVSGVATFKAIGWTADFGSRWIGAWSLAWPIAFVVLLIVTPIVRSAVAALVAPPSQSNQQDIRARIPQ